MISKNVIIYYIIYHLFLGADNLCGRLMEKINSSNNVKQALAHMPLILVCMEVFINILYVTQYSSVCCDTVKSL